MKDNCMIYHNSCIDNLYHFTLDVTVRIKYLIYWWVLNICTQKVT